jgi:predicted  nucleic acid-binding Zn-ribbon protein
VAVQIEPDTLRRLLDLQAEDTAIRRLTEQKNALPEARRLSELKTQLAELESDLEIAGKRHEEIAREVARLEGEVELIDQKIAREQERMYGGHVSNPKELSSLQAEVEMLKRKKSTTEDGLLEAMEARDQAASMIERLTTELNQARTEADELSQKVDALTGDIDGQLRQHESTRAELSPQIPDSVLTLYERLREQKGGVGAAALEGGTCLGCHTKLPAKEVERVRSEGGLQRCDNCRRILVVA